MTGSDGQVVIVTGGASGLGRALVERFVVDGASVVVLDRAPSRLAVEHLPGDRVAMVRGDVAVLHDNQRAVAAAIERFGRLDVFIANAGVFDFGMALADLPEDQICGAFDEIFAVNVKGALLGARAALPDLVRSRGALIFTLSTAAHHAGCAGILYAASKHAVVGLVRQLAHELAPHVRVNGVAPGALRTHLAGPRSLGFEERSVAEVLPPDEVAQRFEPLGRFADPEDQVGPYLLLASRDLGGRITGEVIYADGGFSIRGVTRPAGGWSLVERYSP